MNKTDKIKQLKNQIAKLQKEIKVIEAGTTKYKIYWTDKLFYKKHVTTVEAETITAAKHIFKNRKLNCVNYVSDSGPLKEIVKYTINRVIAVDDSSYIH